MSDLDEPTLERLLREHLSAELDGQLGRSATAFLRHAGQAGRVNRVDTAPDAAAPMRLTDALPATPSAPSAPGALPSRFGRFKGLGGYSNNSHGRLNGWFVGLAGAALAASIAALWAAPAAFRGGAPVVPVRSVRPANPENPGTFIAKSPAPTPGAPTDLAQWDPAATSPPSPQQPTIHWVRNRAWDEGTVVLDDPDADRPDHLVPARKIREQQWEHTQWYDPAQRARVEMTVPRQNVKFVEMDTY